MCEKVAYLNWTSSLTKIEDDVHNVDKEKEKVWVFTKERILKSLKK